MKKENIDDIKLLDELVSIADQTMNMVNQFITSGVIIKFSVKYLHVIASFHHRSIGLYKAIIILNKPENKCSLESLILMRSLFEEVSRLVEILNSDECIQQGLIVHWLITSENDKRELVDSLYKRKNLKKERIEFHNNLDKDIELFMRSLKKDGIKIKKMPDTNKLVMKNLDEVYCSYLIGHVMVHGSHLSHIFKEDIVEKEAEKMKIIDFNKDHFLTKLTAIHVSTLCMLLAHKEFLHYFKLEGLNRCTKLVEKLRNVKLPISNEI